MQPSIEITLYRDDCEETFKTPAKWHICQACEGCGTDRGASVECDGGGFTSSQWADQNEEFKRDYLAGKYERPCEFCAGSGKVLVVDHDALSPADRQCLLQQERDDAAERRIRRMERMMGA